jgi:hypothetical protein
MAAPSFLRVIRLGSRGDDVVFMKRALARAGHGKLSGVTPIQGPFGVRHLKNFQKLKGLRVDGQMGPATFKVLLKTADSKALHHLELARKKLTAPKPKPVEMGKVKLPQFFKATHPTGGLPGYPAIDVFGQPYDTVGAPEDMTITRLSGKSPSLGGVPGGAYGWSIYARGASGARYYLTHFAYRSVVTGQKVKKGQKIGGMCPATVARMPMYLTHIHEGKGT